MPPAEIDDAHQPPDEVIDTDRVLTVPNVVTFVRLLCFPLFLWVLFDQDDRVGAALILAALGATDWVDGWWARRFHQVSTLGKVLDPIADRVLLIGGVVAILVDGAVPLWVGIAAVAREVLVAITALVLASLGARRIDVTWVGKAGAFFLMFAFPMFLGSEGQTRFDDALRVGAWLCVAPGLWFSYLSAARYVPLGKEALAEGRHARGAAPPGTEHDDERTPR